jgi:hypothetical protein
MKKENKDNYFLTTVMAMFIILFMFAVIGTLIVAVHIGMYDIDNTFSSFDCSESETTVSLSETVDTTTTTKEETTETTNETTTEMSTDLTVNTYEIYTDSICESYSLSNFTTITTVTLPTTHTQSVEITTTCNDFGTVETTTESQIVESNNRTFVKTFTRGTYYCYGCSKVGGSGRTLISCAVGDGDVKGSIASSYLFKNYGYNYNGNRTKVYLEISSYPQMNGYYYLDDSDAGNSNVIDFFYINSSECQFKNAGVISVNCYIDT